MFTVTFVLAASQRAMNDGQTLTYARDMPMVPSAGMTVIDGSMDSGTAYVVTGVSMTTEGYDITVYGLIHP